MRRKPHQGFTLIELLIVIAIIAILASVAYPVFTGILEKAHVTQDMNNLRQIGLATQTYLNDNDGAYFLPSDNWMKKLRPDTGTQYLQNWKIFQSPFDKRASSEDPNNAPVSYGFDANAKSNSASLLSDKITNTSVFILFAPAQGATSSVTFTGTAATAVTVDKTGGGSQGTALGGTHTGRRRIDACMADLHVENMLWSLFINNSNSSSDPSAAQRWNP